MSQTASSFENYKIKQRLERLERKRSFNGATCLVSLYMPHGISMPDVTQQLVDERGTAANIKSKQTGKAVATYENMIQQLQNSIFKPWAEERLISLRSQAKS